MNQMTNSANRLLKPHFGKVQGGKKAIFELEKQIETEELKEFKTQNDKMFKSWKRTSVN